LVRLNTGATQKKIDELEYVIGKKIPGDFTAFYKIHDGQSLHNGHHNLIDCEQLLPLENIIFDWKTWKSVTESETFPKELRSEPDKGIKNDWWNPAWIPFTSDGCGDSLCIDLDPDISGFAGQIIRMRHETVERDLIAPSFEGFISKFVFDLESDRYVCVEPWGIVQKNSVFNNP
jgi:cell wall assembly regulator SMI1